MGQKIQLSRAALAQHFEELAKAFNVSIKYISDLHRSQSLQKYELRVGKISEHIEIVRVTDEKTYAIALHELGHLLHPGGYLRDDPRQVDVPVDVRHQEEINAWEWAKRHALVWTRRMRQTEHFGLMSHGVKSEQYDIDPKDLAEAMVSAMRRDPLEELLGVSMQELHNAMREVSEQREYRECLKQQVQNDPTYRRDTSRLKDFVQDLFKEKK